MLYEPGDLWIEFPFSPAYLKIIPATADAVISTVVVQGNIMDDVETELHELIRQAEYKLLVTKSGTVL